MKIADLFAEIGFKFDTIKLREVSKLIGDLNISSIIGATSLVALGEGIKDLITQSSQASSSLLTLQANTGVNTDFAQQFEKASLALGASKDSADGLINSLSKIKSGLALPGGTVPYGLRLMGFTKEDFQGSLEDNIRMISARLSKSRPAANASQAAKEQWQGLLSNVAQSFGTSAEQFKVLLNPELGNTMHQMLTMSHQDLLTNQEATRQWQVAVQNVNQEFQNSTIPLLKQITLLLKDFNVGGGLQNLDRILKNIGDEFEIIHNFLKAGLLNIGSAASYPLINQARLGNELKKDFSAPVTNVKINVAPITIQANDQQEFVKRFDAHFKNYMKLTASQFSLTGGAT